MSMYVYLVTGSEPYEVCDVIRVFTSNKKAEDFRDKCYEYNETKPEPLSISMPDDEWDKLMLEQDAWQKAHPAGGDYSFYTISKMELL